MEVVAKQSEHDLQRRASQEENLHALSEIACEELRDRHPPHPEHAMVDSNLHLATALQMSSNPLSALSDLDVQRFQRSNVQSVGPGSPTKDMVYRPESTKQNDQISQHPGALEAGLPLSELTKQTWVIMEGLQNEIAAAAVTPPSRPPMGLPQVPAPTSAPPAMQLSNDSAVPRPLLKEEHRTSKAQRRGPMDEMRQLVRIMLKLFPQTMDLLAIAEEGGGGNRVTEEQIKVYLRAVLGDDAPTPEWGVPKGWGTYLSELFYWATGKIITPEEARRCAKREQGRPWEIVPEQLQRLELYPAYWPVPFKADEIRKKQEDVRSTIVGGNKRLLEQAPMAPVRAKRIRTNKPHHKHLGDPNMSELETWYQIDRLLMNAQSKLGTTSNEKFHELQLAMQQAVRRFQELKPRLEQEGLLSNALDLASLFGTNWAAINNPLLLTQPDGRTPALPPQQLQQLGIPDVASLLLSQTLQMPMQQPMDGSSGNMSPDTANFMQSQLQQLLLSGGAGLNTLNSNALLSLLTDPSALLGGGTLPDGTPISAAQGQDAEAVLAEQLKLGGFDPATLAATAATLANSENKGFGTAGSMSEPMLLNGIPTSMPSDAQGEQMQATATEDGVGSANQQLQSDMNVAAADAPQDNANQALAAFPNWLADASSAINAAVSNPEGLAALSGPLSPFLTQMANGMSQLSPEGMQLFADLANSSMYSSMLPQNSAMLQLLGNGGASGAIGQAASVSLGLDSANLSSLQLKSNGGVDTNPSSLLLALNQQGINPELWGLMGQAAPMDQSGAPVDAQPDEAAAMVHDAAASQPELEPPAAEQ